MGAKMQIYAKGTALIIVSVVAILASIIWGVLIDSAIHRAARSAINEISTAAMTERMSPSESGNPGISSGRKLEAFSFHLFEFVDGDTVKLQRVQNEKVESIRIMGLDSPETFQSKCPGEYAAGKDAALHLEKLFYQADIIELDFHKTDKYGRRLAVIYLDKRDVADLMVESGHAEYYSDRTKRRNWCQ